MTSSGGNGNSSFDEYPLIPGLSTPAGIAAAPDGSAWFTDVAANQVVHITGQGAQTAYSLGGGSGMISPQGIVRGPDGNFWFTEYGFIGSVSSIGLMSQYPLPTGHTDAVSITVGPDNNLWFTEGGGSIGRITTGGTITEFAVTLGAGTVLSQIAKGPDGKLWFTESGDNPVIGNITTSGTVTEYIMPTSSVLDGISAGPDGNVWFTDTGSIGRMDPSSGSYTLFTVPVTDLRQITQDTDGGLIFSAFGPGTVGRVNLIGGIYKGVQMVQPSGGVDAISVSADDAVWFAEPGLVTVGRVAPHLFTPYPGEKYGRRNPGEPGCYVCLSGDPVNVATGNLTESVTDLSVPARGLPFGFTRSYNSLDAASATASGPLGWGWVGDYNASLSVSSSGLVTVRHGNGSTVTFVPNSTGYSAPARVISTLVHNLDGTWSYTLPDQTTDLFNSNGRLKSISDRNNYTISLSYTSGQLSSITDPPGRTISVGWTSGHITTVTSPNSRTTSYGYDSSGNLHTVTTPGGHVTTYGYDSQHRLTSITAPRGGIIQTSYDTSGRVASQIDPLLHTTSYDYTTPGQTTVTDPNGHVTVYTVDDADNITSVTRGYGTSVAATTSYTYDNAGNRTSMTDPRGHTTSYSYDGAANLLSVTDPLHDTTSYTYTSRNDVATVTDPLGVTTTNSYDANGNLTSTASPLLDSSGHVIATQTTTFHHDDPAHPGDVTSMTDPDGKTWTYTYNGRGDRNSVTDPDGDKTTATYNSDGQQLTAVSARGNVTGCGCAASYTTSYTYWPDGQTHTVTDPLGDVTTSVYDGDGNLSSLTDPDNHTTSYTYDLADQLTTITRADTTTLGYTYDPAGNQASYTDAGGLQTTYSYDALDRLSQTHAPGGQTYTNTYDPDNNLATATNPAGMVATYGYDDDNNPTSISYSDPATPSVSYSYDADGQRTTMVDGTGTTTYTTDSLHRLTNTTRIGGQSIDYGYNLRNLLTTLTYATGKQVSYGYDDAGNPTSVTDWLSNTTTLTPDPDHNLTAIGSPNGVTASYGYDHADQLTSIADATSGGTLATFGYTPDPAGLLTALTTTGTGQGNETYTYTSLNQLKTVNTANYGYDTSDRPTMLNGGITQSFHNAGTLCWTNPTTVLSPNCATPPATATTYTNNGRGDRTTTTAPGQLVATYGYDQLNRLTSYTQGTTTATYSYDGDNLRQTKTVNATTTTYTWATIAGLPQLINDGTTYLIYTPGGLPIEQITASTPNYLHTDRLGSTRLITDPTGTVTATYAYDSYGNQTSHTGTTTSPLTYTSQYQDTETGLYYFRNRYYDTTTAQFLTRDPLTDTTRSPYQYAYDNPLNATDPMGLGPCSSSLVGWVCATGRGIGSGASATWHYTGGEVVHYVGNHTVGLCINASAGAALFGQATGCVALVGGTPTLIGTLGAGGSSPTASLTAGFILSNASQPCELRGPFVYGGTSADLGLSLGDELSVGNDRSNKTIWENQLLTGFGADGPIPFEFHGGLSDTWTWSP